MKENIDTQSESNQDFNEELTAFFTDLANKQVIDDGVPKFTLSEIWDHLA